MGWWADFDQSEVATDFARIAAGGFDCVRLFLKWEDFQPTRQEVDGQMLDRLVAVADLAEQASLKLQPTLFTGHMSGVNWAPSWALSHVPGGDPRFRIVSDGRVNATGLRNWYSDEEITSAQALLATEAAAALAGHDALWAWDLGNENSNCVVPPSRSSARNWLKRITTAIREADKTALVTIGLHMEDLEEDRRLGPLEASEVCDLLSMHGYPIYATWAQDTMDEQLLPFLAHITRWLGNGRDVLFSEFGLPTYPAKHGGTRGLHSSLTVAEEAAAAYTERALAALHGAACPGAMVWCYTDYDPAIWQKPPLDLALHERSFGLWRADGSAKPAVATIQAFAGTTRLNAAHDYAWIDTTPTEFYRNPSQHLPRLYCLYQQS